MHYVNKSAHIVYTMVLSKSESPRKIPVAVVESGANTFTATQHLLPNTRGETVFDLDKVEIQLDPQVPAAADDWGQYRIQIQRDTGAAPAAMLGNNDDRVLYNATVSMASGTQADDITDVYAAEIGKEHVGYAEYIANDSVYVCVEGTALGGAVTLRGRLIGSIEKLNNQQIMALLTSQLD